MVSILKKKNKIFVNLKNITTCLTNIHNYLSQLIPHYYTLLSKVQSINQSYIHTYIHTHTHTHTYIHTYVHTNKQTNIKTISRSVTESSSSALIKYDIEKNVPLIKPSKIFWWFPSQFFLMSSAKDMLYAFLYSSFTSTISTFLKIKNDQCSVIFF